MNSNLELKFDAPLYYTLTSHARDVKAQRLIENFLEIFVQKIQEIIFKKIHIDIN